MQPPGRGPRLSVGRMAAGLAVLVAALVVFIGLGAWQFDGWRAQRAAQERDLTSRAPVPLGSVIGPDDPFPGDDVGRPVDLAGAWVPDSGFLVGPRQRGGRDGWWAVAAVALDDTESAVPVVLGWRPDPVVPEPSGRVLVEGLLQPGEGTLARDEDPTDRLFPELRLASLTQLVDADLVSAYVVTREASPRTGLPAVAPDAVPSVGVSTALRNLLYALQWWIFAVFAVVIWVRFVAEERAVVRASRDRFDP